MEPPRRNSSQRRNQSDHWRSRKAESRLKIYVIESGRIDRKYTENQFKPQSLYLQLAWVADELAGVRYARYIDKRFSELGAEHFGKILEESRDLGAGWDLEKLKDKFTNAGKKKIVSIHRRAG